MNDHSDLEKRLRRLLPVEVPGELRHRLLAAEPPARTVWLRLRWPLAYTALGGAWVVIFLLHLLAPAPPSAGPYVPVASFSGDRANPARATFTAGFSLDHAFLLTRSYNPDSLWP